MSHNPDNSHYVRRVVLPSGRSIEGVYFDSHPPAANAAAPVSDPCDDLHLCPDCDADLVYPPEWQEADSSSWEVALRCPNCEWKAVGIYSQDCVDRFDEHLERGTDALVRDLRRLTRANMEDEVERFVTALQAGAILPEDF